MCVISSLIVYQHIVICGTGLVEKIEIKLLKTILIFI